MMTCRQVRPIISFLIEKEAGPGETLEARRHLDACRPCNERELDLRRVMDSVATMKQPAVPGDVAVLVMDRLRSMRDRLSAQGTGQLAAKWSGLCLILAACLIAASASYRQSLSEIGAYRSAASLIESASVADATEAIVGYATPLALQAAGGKLGSEIEFEPASDLSISMSILATALVLLLALVIPAALTAAWLARRSGHGSILLRQPE